MKPLRKLVVAAILIGLPGEVPCAVLSGTVVSVDARPLSGVVVRLDPTADSVTTDAQGRWSLATQVSLGPGRRVEKRPRAMRCLRRESGHLRLVLGVRSVDGRGAPTEPTDVDFGGGITARGSAVEGLLHLEYSWRGKVFLRDTISKTAPDRQGMVRRFDTTANPDFTYGYVPDASGRVYRTARIGNQVWMAENLNVAVDSSWCFGGSRDSCDRYGRLYQWASAMSLADSCLKSSCADQISAVHRGICPVGWHVPSDADWTRLGDTIIGADPGTMLKSAKFWRLDHQADRLGFGALPGGWRAPPDFLYTGQVGYWWSSSSPAGGYASYRKIVFLTENLTRDENPKSFGYSLRCLMDP